MSLRLKSKRLVKWICLLVTSLVLGVIGVWSCVGIWTSWDFQLLDIYYQHAVRHGHGPPLSSQIVYVTIPDDTYKFFGETVLDRAALAQVNDTLAGYDTAAIAYDIIFPHPSDHPQADQLFTESLKHLGVYLPVGFSASEQVRPFAWQAGSVYERLRAHLRQPIEHGVPRPLYATRALMQMDDFAAVAFNSGHIYAASDPDGIYRHMPMLLKVDSLYFPALTLAMFLDYVRVPFEEIIVNWGREIIIPATRHSTLDRDVLIPIDTQGQAFIPYPQVWQHSFERMAVHTLLQFREDEGLQGNLREFFEGKFVIIGDVASGISDIGSTSLEENSPLVAVHAALLNGLLTGRFYRQWSFWQIIGLICMLGMFLGLSALPRSPWFLYGTGIIILIGLMGLTWQQLLRFFLFPVFTVGGSCLYIFVGLVIGLNVAIAKDQAFIRNAFSKYVPEEVINELLAHPELLQLGGEERILSVLFSDVESFTTIAENMTPSALVSLLNEYLTEMTMIILAHGGIIDKYEGDAIMAEFGAPLALPNHAEMAVRAALAMQQRLSELRPQWEKRGLPALRCRVGINTGTMIVGNMGSNQVFDYTVIGDAVNLASRLESANKFYHTSVMISEDTHAHLPPEMFRTRILDVIKVKGKSHAVKVFEVYGATCELGEAQDLLYYQMYHEAFIAYLSRNFSAAHRQFAATLTLRSNDPAAQAMLDRIEALNADDLPDDWDGSIALTSK